MDKKEILIFYFYCLMFTRGCIKSNRFLVDDAYEYYNDVDVGENVYDYNSPIG